jgi:hypothetical protein
MSAVERHAQLPYRVELHYRAPEKMSMVAVSTNTICTPTNPVPEGRARLAHRFSGG